MLPRFDEAAADRLLEESLAVRSVERTVEEILLPARRRARRGRGALRRPSTASAGAGRPAGSPRRCAPRRRRTAPRASLLIDATAPLDLDALHAQALELVLRRAGVRTLVAARRPRPAAHRPRARRAHPARGRARRAATRRSTRSAGSSTPRAARAARSSRLRLPRRAARDGREHRPAPGRPPARRAREAPRRPGHRRARARDARHSARLSLRGRQNVRAQQVLCAADAAARRPAGPSRPGLAPAGGGQRPPPPDRRPRARGALRLGLLGPRRARDRRRRARAAHAPPPPAHLEGERHRGRRDARRARPRRPHPAAARPPRRVGRADRPRAGDRRPPVPRAHRARRRRSRARRGGEALARSAASSRRSRR